jgi:hypothetical protein
VVSWGERASPFYLDSWGASDAEFRSADAGGKLRLLFQHFHWKVVTGELEPNETPQSIARDPGIPSSYPPELDSGSVEAA